MNHHIPVNGGARTIRAAEDDVFRFERLLSVITAGEIKSLETTVAAAREAGDAALLGRAQSLLSRTQIMQGDHIRAIETAQAAVETFAGLDPVHARHYAGPLSEAIRASGNAFLKLGNVAAALPTIEDAVAIAQTAVDEPGISDYSGVPALSALIRGLVTLGAALFATHETETAIAVYYRVIAVGDARPECYDLCPDDMMIVRWNLIDTLHERALARRGLGDEAGATADLSAAQAVLDAAGERINLDGGNPDRPELALSSYGREGYFGSLARHLLLTGRPAHAVEFYGRQVAEIELGDHEHGTSLAVAHTGLAQAMLALDRPAEALEYSTLALDALDTSDEAVDRAAALLVRSAAYRALGEHAHAYDALEAHHAVRARIEAVAANQYAALMTARLGLERARADVESHRQIAGMLETLGRVGQEITANLDLDRVCSILVAQVRALLVIPTCIVWLLEEDPPVLMLRQSMEQGAVAPPASVDLHDPLSVAARAARERREIVGDRLSYSPSPQATVFAPLLVGERVLGVIAIASGRETPYTENELSIFRTLCTYGAIALDNAAAYAKLERAVETLEATQTELAVRTAEYERLSMTDPLTGLANRRHLVERAAIEIAEQRRKNSQLAVAMFDIDHFKRVNDAHGHAVGDTVLQVVSRVAKEWLRPADFIARIGGEEFALLLPGAGVREARAIAERIRASIADTPIVAGEITVRVTSSFGVASFDTTTDTLDRALKRADVALYNAKEAGRNRVIGGN